MLFNNLPGLAPVLYEGAPNYMRNVDAKRLAVGYRKGRKAHKEEKIRSKENLAQLHKEMVLYKIMKKRTT